MLAPRATLIASVLLSFGLLPNLTAARADTFPDSGLGFDVGPVRFTAAPLSFPMAPVATPVAPLNFPGGPVQSETAATIEVTLPADVLFDFDTAEISRDAQSALHELADLLRARARGPVMIKGYTDALGNDLYNHTLSQRRAAAVKTWLVTREGLRSMAFTTTGLGSRNPVAPNRKPDGADNPEGRQLNRRVTLIIRK